MKFEDISNTHEVFLEVPTEFLYIKCEEHCTELIKENNSLQTRIKNQADYLHELNAKIADLTSRYENQMKTIAKYQEEAKIMKSLARKITEY